MKEGRKSSWVAWVATVLLLGLVLYPLSGGPAAYLGIRFHNHIPGPVHRAHEIFYRPLRWLRLSGPEVVRRPLNRYHRWWVR